MTELSVYRVLLPLVTYVAAENKNQAETVAKKVWEDNDLEDANYNWNNEFTDVEVEDVVGSNEWGLAYYDKERFGPNINIPIKEGIFKINEKETGMNSNSEEIKELEGQIKELQEKVLKLKKEFPNV